MSEIFTTGNAFMPSPDNSKSPVIEHMRSIEQRLYYGPSLPKEPERFWCSITVDGHTHRAMHEKEKDIMYKVEGYECLDDVWPKVTYTFDRYLTLWDM